MLQIGMLQDCLIEPYSPLTVTASRMHMILWGMAQDVMKGQRIDSPVCISLSPLGLRAPFPEIDTLTKSEDNLLIDAKRMYYTILIYNDGS